MLFFDCDEDILVARLKKRAQTSGRADDNDETIKKRLVTFNELSKPVLNYYVKKGVGFSVSLEL